MKHKLDRPADTSRLVDLLDAPRSRQRRRRQPHALWRAFRFLIEVRAQANGVAQRVTPTSRPCGQTRARRRIVGRDFARRCPARGAGPDEDCERPALGFVGSHPGEGTS